MKDRQAQLRNSARQGLNVHSIHYYKWRIVIRIRLYAKMTVLKCFLGLVHFVTKIDPTNSKWATSETSWWQSRSFNMVLIKNFWDSHNNKPVPNNKPVQLCIKTYDYVMHNKINFVCLVIFVCGFMTFCWWLATVTGFHG